MDTDLDAPSVVSATTPPNYTQPIHSHEYTTEVTFYTGPSEAIYYDQWTEKIIAVNQGDIVIIPPNITHTIRNPSNKHVKNISVKLPKALLDRYRSMLINSAKWVEVRKMVTTNAGVSTMDLTDLNVGYNITIYHFSEWVWVHRIVPTGKSMLYVIKWWYIVEFLWKDINTWDEDVVTVWDVIIINPEVPIRIQSIKTRGMIYMVTLL